MINFKSIEERIFQTKVKNGFSTDDVNYEFSRLLEEYHEALECKDDAAKLAWELADMIIFIIAIAKIQGIDLECALLGKLHFNSNREWS